jgi:hypothetical protein
MAKKRARRTLAPLPSLAPESFTPGVIQLANRLIQRAEWTDPEGRTALAARMAKQMRGRRRACPLRCLAAAAQRQRTDQRRSSR